MNEWMNGWIRAITRGRSNARDSDNGTPWAEAAARLHLPRVASHARYKLKLPLVTTQ